MYSYFLYNVCNICIAMPIDYLAMLYRECMMVIFDAVLELDWAYEFLM